CLRSQGARWSSSPCPAAFAYHSATFAFNSVMVGAVMTALAPPTVGLPLFLSEFTREGGGRSTPGWTGLRLSRNLGPGFKREGRLRPRWAAIPLLQVRSQGSAGDPHCDQTRNRSAGGPGRGRCKGSPLPDRETGRASPSDRRVRAWPRA